MKNFIHIIINLFKSINKLDSNIKTWLIVFLLTGSVMFYIKYNLSNYTESAIKYSEEKKCYKELYAESVSISIHSALKDVLILDNKIDNVILLTSHNSTESLSGLSFLYLSSICEVPGTATLAENWKQLSVITYANLIQEIDKNKYLLIDDVENIKNKYSAFYGKLVGSGAKAAIIYPLYSNCKPIGFILIMYNTTISKKVSTETLLSINKISQELVNLMNYDNEIKKWKLIKETEM